MHDLARPRMPQHLPVIAAIRVRPKPSAIHDHDFDVLRQHKVMITTANARREQT
jgi:hypothetical protein